MALRLTKPANTAATGAPTITGTAQVGQTLTANKGTIDDSDMEPDNFPTGYSFQWVRVDGTTETDISGATSRTYTLAADDVGKRVKVTVSFTDGLGYSESRTSAAYPSSGTVTDTTAPTVSMATVDGTSLVITFSETLAAAANLANSAFTVKKTPMGGSEATVSLSGSPAISGAAVTLTLAAAAAATDTGVKVSYIRPTSGSNNKLKDAANNEVASFTDQTVTNNTAATAPPAPTKPTLVSATATSLTVAWTHPGTGSSPLVRNFVHYRVDGASNWTNHHTGGSPVTRTTIPNLRSNTRYRVRVSVTNLVGGSDWSETSEPFSTLPGPTATAGVTLTGTQNLSTTEGGGTASFEAVLNTQPSANVTVRPSSSDPTEGRVSAALTFTAANWDTAQTVTVTGVDDATEDGNRTYQVRFTVSSIDGDYHGIAVPAVSVINKDNERVTDTTTPRLLHGELWVDWATLTMTFDDVLDAASVPDAADFDVYATSRPWSVGPRVPLGGVRVTGRTVVLSLQRPVQGADRVLLSYNFRDGGMPLKDTANNALWVGGTYVVDNRTITVEDPETATAGVTLTGTTGLRTREAGGTASFYVVLDTQPSAQVTVRLSSSDASEGRVTTEGQYMRRFDFTPRDWDRRQKVIVTGVDDTEDDGDQAYLVRFEVSSPDKVYNGIGVAAVTVINTDDDLVNAPPTVANPLPDVVATEGAAFRHTVAADAFGDADGDALSYTASLGGGGALPGWLRFIAATRTFIGTPTSSAAGKTLVVTVTAADGNGGTATASFQIAVVAAEPEAVGAVKSLEIKGDTLTMEFNSTPDTASNPSRDHFTVTVRYEEESDCGTFGNSCGPFDRPGTRVRVSTMQVRGARVQGDKVVLRLSGSVKYGYEVRLDYDPSRTDAGSHLYSPTATPILFSSGMKVTKLPAFANRAVQNNTSLLLSVGDAVVREGAGAALRFNVRLDAPGDRTVTVDYATADGTAVAGQDYTAVSGKLTFAPGERKKTVLVPVLDDAHDERDETLRLTLSNAAPSAHVQLGDAEAIGTITNSGPMPGAWVARLGRTLGSQVVEAVSARADGGASGSHLNVGGVSLIGGGTALDAAAPLTPGDWLARQMAAGPQAQRPQARTLTGRDLLLGSSFHLVSGSGDGGGAVWSAWGRVSSGGFQAEADGVAMDGQVVSGMLGFDAAWERVMAGVLVLRSEADGAYTLQGGSDAGTLDSALTGVYPYARLRLGGRLSVWAVAGIGTGDLTLNRPDETMDTGLDVRLGALGVRGALPAVGGLDLAVKSDVLWVRTASDAVAGQLAATSADVNRLRLILEGGRPWTLSSGAVLAPTVQVGLRHDGGDAETGSGVEVGAGLRYDAGILSVDAQVRTLLAHEAGGYEEWGASGSVRLSPNAAGLGPSLAVLPSWGAPGSAAERLWSQPDASALVAGGAAAAGRVDAELGWGLSALRGRGVLTPYARLALAEGQDRSWHLGTRLALSESLDLSLEGSHRQTGGGTAHDLTLRATLPW